MHLDSKWSQTVYLHERRQQDFLGPRIVLSTDKYHHWNDLHVYGDAHWKVCIRRTHFRESRMAAHWTFLWTFFRGGPPPGVRLRQRGCSAVRLEPLHQTRTSRSGRLSSCGRSDRSGPAAPLHRTENSSCSGEPNWVLLSVLCCHHMAVYCYWDGV